ncbi:sugar phosphate isomerase/epimerase family protein [Prosthecobacter sp.]|uniref:sugar phosphate isomerase/epimerase family protein n=1 Tax=Prosthecobacter sp. TaxID=1965333 RepID=UPI002ABADA8A|nr:sugar phosphate isomerase/epimerase family protein [Prosthecobacter sp.]MDZ4402858.1 sugar phosphate isomerase/epimerase family protein [Prosthecobacter sp.]
MKPTAFSPSRRQFLATAGAASLSLLSSSNAATFKTVIKKAKIIGKPEEKALRDLKDAGFDGVEVSFLFDDETEAKKARELVEGIGLKVHSVLRGWAEFNSDDPGQVAASYAVTEKALRTANWLGAETILLVPCRVGGPTVKMPEPWEFDIEFDEKTGHVSRVVKGDNTPFARYIALQNKSTDGSKEQVTKLIPLAEKLNVIIGLENVWNNLWVRPDLYKNFVASFNHPFVQAYYDVGNHVKYLVPVHDWIHTLGGLIKKIHIKDYALAPDNKSGKFVHPRDGSIDWPKMRQALDDVGYNGWITVEDNGLPLPEFTDRLNKIIAGV